MPIIIALISLLAPAFAFAPPPWSFPNARVLYQPTFVPVEAARAVTPSRGVNLLSLFGWTLGGVFVVEWTASPVGPYREVAVLSGLVARGLSLGAWASHIVVTTPDAVEAGREVFGLPTRLGSVSFSASSESSWRGVGLRAARGAATGLKAAFGAAAPGVAEPVEGLRAAPASAPRGFRFDGDGAISVCGWDDGWSSDPQDDASADGASLSLPSFSGRLRTPAGETPLLRYPLVLGPTRRARLRPPMPTLASESVEDDLKAILGGPFACPCIQVDGVMVVAGRPEEVAS
jgi:hypothetical protein